MYVQPGVATDLTDKNGLLATSVLAASCRYGRRARVWCSGHRESASEVCERRSVGASLSDRATRDVMSPKEASPGRTSRQVRTFARYSAWDAAHLEPARIPTYYGLGLTGARAWLDCGRFGLPWSSDCSSYRIRACKYRIDLSLPFQGLICCDIWLEKNSAVSGMYTYL